MREGGGGEGGRNEAWPEGQDHIEVARWGMDAQIKQKKVNDTGSRG